MEYHYVREAVERAEGDKSFRLKLEGHDHEGRNVSEATNIARRT